MAISLKNNGGGNRFRDYDHCLVGARHGMVGPISASRVVGPGCRP